MRGIVWVAITVCGLLLPVDVRGQAGARVGDVIAGSVIDASTGEAVRGAIVLATDAGREILRGTLTDSVGDFTLDRLRMVAVQLVVERLGYATATIPLAGARDGALTVRLTPAPIRLEAVTASVEAICEVDPAGSERTHGLWNAARFSLRAALVSEQEGLVRFRVATWLRETSEQGEVLAELEGREAVAVRQPFVTRPAEKLARDGYVVRDGIDFTFFGPDAAVLLSEPFLSTHCFRPAHPRQDFPGLVGLTFEPLPRRTIPDIAGTFWIEPTSGELRALEYRYVEGDRPFRLGGDGEMRFRALDEGPWVVDFWRIRSPVGLDERRRVTFYEAGGELLEVLTAEP